MRVFTRPGSVDPAVVPIGGEIVDAQEYFDREADEMAAEMVADPHRPRSGRGLAAILAATTFVSSTFVLADRLNEVQDSALLVGPGPGAPELTVPYPGLEFPGSAFRPEDAVTGLADLFAPGVVETPAETTTTSTLATTTTTLKPAVQTVAEVPVRVAAPATNTTAAPEVTVTTSAPRTTTTATTVPSPPTTVESQPEFRYMSGGDFVNAYYNAQPQPDTVYGAKPEIYGDSAADQRIRSIAESRGYRLQPLSTTGSLNTRTMRAFDRMANAASNEAGVDLWIVSGYRSVDTQRELFQERVVEYFGGTPTAQEIVSGAADDAINATFDQRSAPGYSRHHSGYVIDVNRLDNSFLNTRAYEWLSANNFYNARRFGWVPSYPPGVKAGPLPESWEFAYIVNEASVQ